MCDPRTMKICNACGRELTDQARFCDRCGVPQPVQARPRAEIRELPRIETGSLLERFGKILPKGANRGLVIVLFACVIINLAYWALFPYSFQLLDQYTGVPTLWDSGFFKTVAFEYSRLAVLNHVFPYTASLPGYPFDTLEYPFLAGYLFYIIYLLSGGSFPAYVTIFQFITLIAEVGVGGLVYLIGKRFLSERRALLVAILYSLTPSMLFFTFSRYDSISTFVSLLAVFQFISKRYRWATVFATIGAFLRFYPAILLILFLKYGWTNHFDRKYFRDAVGIPVITGIAIVLPLLLLKPTAIVRLFAFSASFAWNWESVWGPIDRFVRPIVPQFKFFYDNQAWMRVPFTILLLSVPFLTVRDVKAVLNAYALAMIYWLNTAWLFSPQYAVWIYPILLALSGSKKFLSLSVLFALVITIEIPSPYFYLFPMTEFYLVVSASAVRIIILAVLGVILLFRLEKPRISASLARLAAKWNTEE